MKNLITAIASVIILMVFLLQFVNNQTLHQKVMGVDRQLWCIKEVVKQEGRLTDLRKNQLKEDLSELVKCEVDEIDLYGTSELKLRGEIIEIHLSLPIKNLIAANEFFGISENDNEEIYESDIYTTSEYIMRAQ